MLFGQNSYYKSMCLTHWHARKKWRIEVRERVMVVVKQRQPNAFFSFSFSSRLIVNIVRRRKKKRKKNEDDDDDEENSRGGGSSSGTS